MQTYNSFNELAVANGGKSITPLSMFNYEMSGEKFKRLMGTPPQNLSDEDLKFGIDDTKEDVERDQRRGERSHGTRLHERLKAEFERRHGAQGSGVGVGTAKPSQQQPSAQPQRATQHTPPQIKATSPDAQRVLEAAASGQLPTTRQDLMQILGAARASGNKMSDDLRKKIIADVKGALQGAA